MRSILAAISLEGDGDVLKWARALARDHSARLTVLTVAEDLWFDAPDISDLPEVQEARNGALAGIRQKANSLAASGSDVAEQTEVRVEVGKASNRIPQVADEVAADMIVMGAARRRSLRERMLGSTADRVVRCSAVPVLVVKGPPKAGYRHVIAALDLSSRSEPVARTAAGLSAAGILELVHVVHVPLALEQAFLRSATVGGRLPNYKAALITKARDYLCRLAQGLATEQEPRLRVLVGDPVAVLLRLSRRPGPNLLVASRNSKGAIDRMLLGSVASRLLRRSRCDVLIVPFPAPAPGKDGL